jgi:hypothetical protein
LGRRTQSAAVKKLTTVGLKLEDADVERLDRLVAVTNAAAPPILQGASVCSRHSVAIVCLKLGLTLAEKQMTERSEDE